MPPLSFKLAYTPDPVDGRDILFNHASNPVLAASPASTGDHVIVEYTPIGDQGQVGSCAANASADALEMLIGLEDPTKVVQISRLHIYWASRALDGNTKQDAGTFLRSCCTQMHKVGVCAEDVWPYVNVEKNIFVPPPIEATVRASENRISGYYRVGSTGRQRLLDVATSIRANHPVVFGTQVGNAFMQSDGKSALRPDPNDIEGGHATILMGVQTVAGRMQFRLRNSWGPTWADQGHVWLDQDYIVWENTCDLWSLTRMTPLL